MSDRKKASERFEDQLAKLESIVARLEDDSVGLEEALGLFENGMDLAKKCRERLEEVETRVSQLLEGEILVAPTTSPSWAPAFAKIGACVTDVGGDLSHAAIVCREYGMPAVVGTGHATKVIKTGMMLRVDGSTGAITIAR